ncbi:MAG: glycoside hydrolase family 19 protein [Nitrosomonas sp.]|nr:glycoside hydrolase family 19 protein [Nitrosomonas sp.]
MIDYSKLTKHLPEHVYVQILDVVIKYKINTPLRLAHFLAQIHHESAGFNVVEENLNYSAEGLLRTFKKYFAQEQAQEYAHNKVRIASRVYANRMGNGDEASQEGWLYRGRGYIQLTGKNNYAAFNDQVPEDILKNPDLVATRYPMLSAAWFWDHNNINEMCDNGNVVDVTKRVNGGLNGVDDRWDLFAHYYDILKNV